MPQARAADRSPARPDDIGRALTLGRQLHLFREGDAARDVYFIVAGSLLSYRFTPSGRRLIPAIYMPGDIVGLEARGEFGVSCIALSDVTARACARAQLLSLMCDDKRVCEFVLTKVMADRLDHEQYAQLLGAPALARVCGFILRMARHCRDSACVDLPVSRAETAEHLCLTVETTSRLFTQLRADRIIDYDNVRSVRILQRSYLEEHAES